MIIFVFFNKKQSDQTLLKSLVSRWSLRYHNVTVMVWITFHICPDLIRNISLWVGNHCVNIGGKDQTAGKFGTTVTFSSRLYLQQQYKFEPQFDKTNKITCAPSEDSDQPGHQPSMIRVFTVRMKKPRVLGYPMSAQGILWSDWAGAQALIRQGGCPG